MHGVCVWKCMCVCWEEVVLVLVMGGGPFKKITVLPHVVICKTTDLNSGKPNQTPLLQPPFTFLGEKRENVTDRREVICAQVYENQSPTV